MHRHAHTAFTIALGGLLLMGTTACGGAGQAASGGAAATPRAVVTVTETATPTPTPTPEQSAPSPASATVSSESVDRHEALAVVRKNAPRFRTVTNAQINVFAGAVCKSLRQPGGTLNRVDRANLSSGMTSIESVSITTYSVYTTCPEFTPDLQRWINSM